MSIFFEDDHMLAKAVESFKSVIKFTLLKLLQDF